MHKWILSFTACVMLSACSADEEKKRKPQRMKTAARNTMKPQTQKGKRSRSLLPSWMTGLMRV